MGNPPLFPLIYDTDCEDVLIVQINPIQVDEVPKTAPAIVDRMNELSFNSSLDARDARDRLRQEAAGRGARAAAGATRT